MNACHQAIDRLWLIAGGLEVGNDAERGHAPSLSGPPDMGRSLTSFRRR